MEAGRTAAWMDRFGEAAYAMAVIGRDGKVRFSNGKTGPAGRQGLYGKLEAGDKVCLETGDPAFRMAYAIKGRAGSEAAVLQAGKQEMRRRVLPAGRRRQLRSEKSS
jgi:hypothetical protein